MPVNRNSFISNENYFCGEFNAKNSAGGYVGFNRFIIGGITGGVKDNDASVTLEGTEIVGLNGIIEVLESENEILRERKRLSDRGEKLQKLEYIYDVERKRKAKEMAFEKIWATKCVR